MNSRFKANFFVMQSFYKLSIFYKIIGLLFFIGVSNPFLVEADTVKVVDTVKYGSDSLVIEESISITDTLKIGNDSVEMADTLRANGKIYVVVLVLLIVLVGILIFLIFIDRRLKKLEEKQ